MEGRRVALALVVMMATLGLGCARGDLAPSDGPAADSAAQTDLAAEAAASDAADTPPEATDATSTGVGDATPGGGDGAPRDLAADAPGDGAREVLDAGAPDGHDATTGDVRDGALSDGTPDTTDWSKHVPCLFPSNDPPAGKVWDIWNPEIVCKVHCTGGQSGTDAETWIEQTAKGSGTFRARVVQTRPEPLAMTFDEVLGNWTSHFHHFAQGPGPTGYFSVLTRGWVEDQNLLFASGGVGQYAPGSVINTTSIFCEISYNQYPNGDAYDPGL